MSSILLRRRFTAGISLFTALLAAQPSFAAEAAAGVQQGTVRYEVPGGDDKVAERFRLAAHDFSFEQKPLGAATEQISLWTVTFPSPVKTPHENNNTVHCELYLPKRSEKTPAVVVLHILGGDFNLSRLFCAGLAEKGVAALFLKMPYYGPRQQPGVKRRMISPDPRETVEGMTQAVLDIRRATAFLATRPEIDAKRLGIFGISLGGITGALATTAEPRLASGCFLLAGGDLAQVALDPKNLERVRKEIRFEVGDEKKFRETLAAIDPVKYAANIKGRRILMLNAASDELIPKACTLSLWEAFGKQEIVWYDGGHYSVAKHILDALRRTSTFFATK